MNEDLSIPDGMDEGAVNLARSIRKQESGGDYNKYGDNNSSYGAYQWNNQPNGKSIALKKGELPSNWITSAKEAGLDPKDFSPKNQDMVAYRKIKKYKDQGYNVPDIAALWNGGDAKRQDPNYITPSGLPSQRKGIYDVPAYAQKVNDYYQELKTKTSAQQPPETPEIAPKESFLGGIAKSIVSPVATMVARPIQAGAELLGASAEDVNKATQNIAGDWVAPVPQNAQDVVKDIGRAAQTVALGTPVGTLRGAIGTGALAGAGAGLEKEGTLASAAKGGAIGGVLGLAGGAVSKALDYLPTSLTSSAFKDLNPEQIQKVLSEKSIGTKSGLLEQSNKAVANYGNTIDDILKKSTATGSSDDSLRKVFIQYPEYNTQKGTIKLIDKIKSLIPSDVVGMDRATVLSSIDKIADGTATLYEKNKVRSAIDSATKGTWAKMARGINPKAGHDIAIEFANNLRNEVQSWAPDTIPVFKEFAKEMGIQKALSKLVNKPEESLIGYKEIMPFLGVNALGGAGAGIGAAVLERAQRTPAIKFGVAKMLQGAGKVIKPVASRTGLLAPASLK